MAWKEIRVLSVERSENRKRTQFTNIVAFSFLQLHEEGEENPLLLFRCMYALTLFNQDLDPIPLFCIMCSLQFSLLIFGWQPGRKVLLYGLVMHGHVKKS